MWLNILRYRVRVTESQWDTLTQKSTEISQVPGLIGSVYHNSLFLFRVRTTLVVTHSTHTKPSISFVKHAEYTPSTILAPIQMGVAFHCTA